MKMHRLPASGVTLPFALALGLSVQPGLAPALASVQRPLAPMLPDMIVDVQSTTDAQAPAAPVQEPSASDLRDAIADIKRRLAEQQEGRESTGTGELTAELRAARETISELTQGMNRLRSERDNILSELQRMGDEISLRSDQIATLERELEQVTTSSTAEREQLEADLAQRLAERDGARDELANSAARLEAALAETDQLTTVLGQLRSEQATLEETLAESSATSQAELGKRNETITAADAEIERLTTELANETAALAATAVEGEDLRAQLNAMTLAAQNGSQEAEQNAAQAAALELQLQSERKARDLAEAELATQRERVRQVSLEAEGRLQERTSTLTSSIQSAEQRIEELETEMTSLREVATASVSEVQVLGEQLLTTFRENEELVNALTEVRGSKSLIESELEAARRDVELYSAQAALGSRGGDDASTAIVASLQEELRTARAEINELSEQLIRQDQLATDEGDPTTLSDRLLELEAQLADTSAQNAELSTELAILKGDAAGETSVDAVQSVSVSDPQVAQLLSELNAVEAGAGWIMTVPDGIIFAPGSDELADEANEPLSKVASLLRYFADQPVRVVGHTDSYGDPNVNRVLSVARAESVRDYLAGNFGLNVSRIAAEGFGEEQPIASNDTVSGRRANRRVEVFVLSE